MATVLAVVMCRGCKVQVFDDGTILRIDDSMPLVSKVTPVAAMQTWRDMRQNGPLVGWDPLP